MTPKFLDVRVEDISPASTKPTMIILPNREIVMDDEVEYEKMPHSLKRWMGKNSQSMNKSALLSDEP